MSSFTFKYPRIVNQLITNRVSLINGNKKNDNIIALWDTGATCSCISKLMISRLSLIPISKTKILTPSGEKIFNQYYLNVKLPNGARVNNCLVCESEIDRQNLDIIIGMGIISRGDFAISNNKHRTIFSYRIPSLSNIDFVKEENAFKK